MTTYEEAQILFNAYQKNGSFHKLRDALDLLIEIIETEDTDLHKATNFKNTISKIISDQISNILVKCNILDFAGDLDNLDNIDLLRDKLATAMAASFSKEDSEAFVELMTIKRDYFGQAKQKQ